MISRMREAPARTPAVNQNCPKKMDAAKPVDRNIETVPLPVSIASQDCFRSFIPGFYLSRQSAGIPHGGQVSNLTDSQFDCVGWSETNTDRCRFACRARDA